MGRRGGKRKGERGGEERDGREVMGDMSVNAHTGHKDMESPISYINHTPTLS